MVLFHLIVWLTPSHFNWLPRSCSAPSLSRPGVTPREAQYASLPSSPAWRTKAHGVKWNLKYLRRLLRDGLWPYGACQFDPYLLPGSHQEQILQWQPLAWTFSFGAITARDLAPEAYHQHRSFLFRTPSQVKPVAPLSVDLAVLLGYFPFIWYFWKLLTIKLWEPID